MPRSCCSSDLAGTSTPYPPGRTGLGERRVYRQPQILTVHAAILAKPDEYPDHPESQVRKNVFLPARHAPTSKRAMSRGKGVTMHPMFVQLYLEPDADQDEQDKRRRAARARRLRTRAAVRVTTPAADRDRRP